MTWAHTYTPYGVDVRFSDLATGQDTYDATAEALQHSQCQPLQYAVWDFTGVTAIDIATDDVIRIADQDKLYVQHAPGFPFVVVASHSALYGLVRMYQVLVDKSLFPAKIIRTRREAIEWLAARGVNTEGLSEA